MNKSILGIKIDSDSINESLDKVKIILNKNRLCYHIVNLNPDTFTIALKNSEFRNVLNQASIQLVDGVGIKILGFISGIKSGEKMAGTDFMTLLIKLAAKNGKKTFFLGGRDDSAKLTARYFKQKYPGLKTAWNSGPKNIRLLSVYEKKLIINSINNFSPDFLFVAYGPPNQEFFIHKNRSKLKGVICMGVGGSFNFFSKKAIRAPRLIVNFGFEWLWRFIWEPSRTIRKLPNYFSFLRLIIYLFIKKWSIKSPLYEF